MGRMKSTIDSSLFGLVYKRMLSSIGNMTSTLIQVKENFIQSLPLLPSQCSTVIISFINVAKMALYAIPVLFGLRWAIYTTERDEYYLIFRRDLFR